MEKMLNLVLFGPPGAGKGTQSENLINKYGLVHLSTGDILRSEIANGTALGKQAREVMDRGELVSDDIVIGMIESKLDQNPHAKGFIFDGFPRTTAQAVALDDLLQRKGTGISAMLALEVDDEELTRRLLKRGQDSGRADDANETVIRRRIQEYNTKTLPLKNYYSEQGKFHSINGIGTIDEIFKALTDRIVFINAEMDLTALETDIEHLDLTIQDFDVADDIAPELLLEIDAIKRAEAEEEEEERESKGKKTAGGSKQEARRSAQKAAASKQKAGGSGQKAGGSKQKAAGSGQKAGGSMQKAVAKKVSSSKSPKKTAAKKTSKATKKAAPKKVAKKSGAKKATKKIAKKAAKKAIRNKAIRGKQKAGNAKKAAPKKAAKKNKKR